MKKIITVFSILFTMILVLVISFVTTKASSDVVNLASPDLIDKEYLGDGVYRLISRSGLTFDYDVYSGDIIINGTSTSTSMGVIFNLVTPLLNGETYTFTRVADLSEKRFSIYISEPFQLVLTSLNFVNTLVLNGNQSNIVFTDIQVGYVFNNYRFKLQIEQGTTATAYQTPIGALKQHSQLDLNRGYADGYIDGGSDGYADGYDVGYDVGYDDASIIGFPENLAEWYSVNLYSNYYHMTTGKIILDTNRKGITVIVPDFDNIITSAGQGTEQKIVFYDSLDNEILSHSVYGRLTGRFDYSIPVGAYSFTYYVLVQGPLPSDYVYEWNKVAYVGYKDLLTTYSQAWQNGYDVGYDIGYDDGQFVGYHDGKDYGYELGKIEAVDKYKDEWFQQGESVGYAKGLDENVATGGFIMILSSAFIGVSTLLGIELLPNITLGMIVAVPLVFGILFFILGKRKD